MSIDVQNERPQEQVLKLDQDHVYALHVCVSRDYAPPLLHAYAVDYALQSESENAQELLENEHALPSLDQVSCLEIFITIVFKTIF